MRVRVPEDLAKIAARINAAADEAARKLLSFPQRGTKLLKRIKFEEIGRHPLEDRDLNLIEQVNQTFTWLVGLKALEVLCEEHPEIKEYELDPGFSNPGTDIESVPSGFIAAEVFSAVRPTNNRKLSKDRRKVLETSAKHKYVFFCCPGYAMGRQSDLEVPGVKVWSVDI